jgi:spore germination cell wall hydrolase CwlJ-like protein
VTGSSVLRRIWIASHLAVVVLLACEPNAVEQARGPEVTERMAEALEHNAASAGSQASPTAAQTIAVSDAQAVDPSGDEPLDDTITCLARTIYWEARGEGAAGMEAVASVVMNRLGHAGFPDTVCKVVMQGHEQGSCQFSWWCDGRADQANDDDSYAIAKEIARRALNQQLPDRTSGALYFHQRAATPAWAGAYLQTVEVGAFVFYKPHGGDAR